MLFLYIRGFAMEKMLIQVGETLSINIAIHLQYGMHVQRMPQDKF